MAKPKRPENRTPNERLLRATWMAAYERGELTLTFPTASSLYRTRFQLNSDAKAHKEFPDVDPEYTMAVQVLGIETNLSKLQITLGAVASNALSKSLAEAVGQEAVEAILGDDAAASSDIAASMSKLSIALGSEAPQHHRSGSNPLDIYSED